MTSENSMNCHGTRRSRIMPLEKNTDRKQKSYGFKFTSSKTKSLVIF